MDISPPTRTPEYASRLSRYGYGCDVRATYGHLPFQAFWTWVTGKSLCKQPPKRPVETLLTERQLWCQLLWSWSIIIGSICLGVAVYESSLSLFAKLPVYCVVWVLVMNRTRGLLHTFHYTNHGASIANMKRARWIGTLFMSIPILHTSWRNYHRIHAETHHALRKLCTDDDPDQQFMTQHGFYLGMPEREYWLRLVYAPFLPKNLWAHIRFRLQENFITPGATEIALRVTYWVLFFAASIYFGVLHYLAVFLFFPLFLLTQHSSWIQHTTEHLWFPNYPQGTSRLVAMASLTWGRFLGRPHPGKGRGIRHMLRLARWWSLIFLVDIPIRLYAFMQDLPSHDFHHRSPRCNFWSIAPQRSANEGLPSKYGPMTETWSVMESWLVLRDHLCRGQHDPFQIYEFDRMQREQRAARKTHPAGQVRDLDGVAAAAG